MFNLIKKSYENSHIPPYCKQCVFVMNQKRVFGYRFLVTNRNVFEGHENTPLVPNISVHSDKLILEGKENVKWSPEKVLSQ